MSYIQNKEQFLKQVYEAIEAYPDFYPYVVCTKINKLDCINVIELESELEKIVRSEGIKATIAVHAYDSRTGDCTVYVLVDF